MYKSVIDKGPLSLCLCNNEINKFTPDYEIFLQIMVWLI